MREEFMLGIGPTIQTTTDECSKPSLFSGPWYNIVMTNEYEEDGKTQYQDHLYGYCTDEGLTGAITQAEFPGTDEKAKDNFIKNILEAIPAIRECDKEK